jgi:transposase
MEAMGLTYKKASKPESTKGFVSVKGRWVVERSISWTNIFRRLVKDHERTVSSSEFWLILANIQIMLQRISPTCQI